MLKAVRISATQQMPNYRKPSSFLIKESYPLPPYSSVIGLVHTLCGWTGENKGYHEMSVSVQGQFASSVSDYAINYTFGGVRYEAGRHAFGVDVGGGRLDGINRSPRSYEVLTDMKLVIHVIPKDQSLIDNIREAFLNPSVYPSLGRYEDLLRIDDVCVTDIEETEDDVITEMDSYIPLQSIDKNFAGNMMGTIYKLGKVFAYRGTKNMRYWKESVIARYVCAGTSVSSYKGIFIDKQHNEGVFPA